MIFFQNAIRSDEQREKSIFLMLHLLCAVQCQCHMKCKRRYGDDVSFSSFGCYVTHNISFVFVYLSIKKSRKSRLLNEWHTLGVYTVNADNFYSVFPHKCIVSFWTIKLLLFWIFSADIIIFAFYRSRFAVKDVFQMSLELCVEHNNNNSCIRNEIRLVKVSNFS